MWYRISLVGGCGGGGQNDVPTNMPNRISASFIEMFYKLEDRFAMPGHTSFIWNPVHVLRH